MTKIERAKISAYAARHDGEKFRVSRSGEVHILGQMPNSTTRGWWFAGWGDEIIAEMSAL
jgi:hypothetical protein